YSGTDERALVSSCACNASADPTTILPYQNRRRARVPTRRTGHVPHSPVVSCVRTTIYCTSGVIEDQSRSIARENSVVCASSPSSETTPRDHLQELIARGAGNTPDAIMLRLLWLRQ